MTNDIDELICLIRKFTKSCTIAKYICMCGFFAVITISSDDDIDDVDGAANEHSQSQQQPRRRR